ncbi:hypothetical protein K8I28_09330 [bacterium]|nr:hypothetical protein [bacterium]
MADDSGLQPVLPRNPSYRFPDRQKKKRRQESERDNDSDTEQEKTDDDNPAVPPESDSTIDIRA